MTTAHMSTESAIAHYNNLLATKHIESTKEQLATLNADPRVHRANDPICKMLRPTLIAEGTYNQGNRDGLAVIKALHIAAQYLRGEDGLCELLRLEESLGWRLFIDHEVAGVRVNGRLDGLPTKSGTLMFAEYNTNLVGGVVQSHLLPRLLAPMPLLSEFSERYPLTTPSTEGQASAAIRKAHQFNGGERAPVFQVVFGGGAGEQLPHDVQEAMMLLQQISAEDVDLIVDMAGALDYRDGRLWNGDTAIDFLYAPDDEWPNIFSRFGLDHPLFQDAIPNGRVRILNGASLGGLVSEKSMFELLTRPDLQHLFDESTQASLARAIPWTRLVAGRTVDHHGNNVDLLDLAVKQQQDFVLKPTSEEGGEGVVLGWTVDGETWERALRDAMTRPSILQERVELDVQPFPRWTDGGLEIVPCRYSADPFVWNDERTSGCLSRVSMTDMLNVAGTASLSPVFILEGVER